MYAHKCSEWIKEIGTIINAQVVYSKCMPSVITAPLCNKFLIDLAAPCCVCPTLHSPILFIIVLLIIILRESTMRAPSIMVTMISMTMMIVQIARLLTMTAIVCVIPVTAMRPPPFSKILGDRKFLFMNNMSSSSCGLMFSCHDDGIWNWGGTGMSSVLWGMNPILSWDEL